MPDRFVTVHVRQGHYGVDPERFDPAPDLSIEHIADLRGFSLAELRGHVGTSRTLGGAGILAEVQSGGDDNPSDGSGSMAVAASWRSRLLRSLRDDWPNWLILAIVIVLLLKFYASTFFLANWRAYTLQDNLTAGCAVLLVCVFLRHSTHPLGVGQEVSTGSEKA